MSKSSLFIEQPIYSQLLNLLAKSQVLHHSRAYKGKVYQTFLCLGTSRRDVLCRGQMFFDSLREIIVYQQYNYYKIKHLILITGNMQYLIRRQ